MGSSGQESAWVRQIAGDVLGFAALRPAQEEAAASLASDRDCLAVLPSGAGKSAIYQIAAIALGGPGLVLEADGDRVTVLFDEYGYRELSAHVVSGRHLLEPQ